MLYAAAAVAYGAALGAATVNSGGPSFTVHGWEAWIIILGAVCGALYAIWKFVRPMILAAWTVARSVETLNTIATEFRPNSGGSLHDRITRIDTTLADRSQVLARIDEKTSEAVEQGKTAVDVAAEAKEVASATSEKVDQTHDLLLQTRQDVVDLHNYTHEGHHAIVKAMTTIAPGIDVIVALAEKLSDQPKRLEN